MRRLHYIILGVVLLFIFGTFFFFNKSETTGNVVDECVAPSVLIDGVCCIDSNSDAVCDAPEEIGTSSDVGDVVAETPEAEYKNFKAKIYLSSDVLATDGSLPENPEKISSFVLDGSKTDLADGKKYYGKYPLYTYLDGSYNEEINCNIDEYYGTVLSDKFLVEIPAGQKSGITNVGYEFVGTPSKVRYDLDCVGFDSKIEWKDSYTYDLVVKS